MTRRCFSDVLYCLTLSGYRLPLSGTPYNANETGRSLMSIVSHEGWKCLRQFQVLASEKIASQGTSYYFKMQMWHDQGGGIWTEGVSGETANLDLHIKSLDFNIRLSQWNLGLNYEMPVFKLCLSPSDWFCVEFEKQKSLSCEQWWWHDNRYRDLGDERQEGSSTQLGIVLTERHV